MPEGELQKVVGVNLRRIRTERGLSLEAFAELLGFDRTSVGDLERGERNLSLRSLERIAEMVGCEPLTLPSADSRLGAGHVVSQATPSPSRSSPSR